MCEIDYGTLLRYPEVYENKRNAEMRCKELQRKKSENPKSVSDSEIVSAQGDLLEANKAYNIVWNEINLLKMVAERERQRKIREQSGVYQSLLDILDAYWLSVPEEMIVDIDLHFVNADGEEQFKTLVWTNSEYEDKVKRFRMLEEEREKGGWY